MSPLPLQKSMIVGMGMLLILRRSLLTQAYMTTNINAKTNNIRTTRSIWINNIDSCTKKAKNVNHFRRTRTAVTVTTLHAVESRELRFYSSPLVLDIPFHDNGTLSTWNPDGKFNGDAFMNMNRKPNESPLDSLINNFASAGSKLDSNSKSTDGKKLDDPFSSLFSIIHGRDKKKHEKKNGSTNKGNGKGKGSNIHLTQEEEDLFNLLTEVIQDTDVTSTLRVAGGWVRDKLLATEEFKRGNNSLKDGSVDRLTSKFKGPSSGRQGSKLIGVDSAASSSSPQSLVKAQDVPVDIDIALDDMLGREFADHLNDWLTDHGGDKISVGVVLKNPEKSKHLETATMKVGKFWIDFVNLRAEEYTEDSRIPDLMRIGTAQEDALRRDLTINSLFYNINTGEVEDFTGKGLDDLKRGVVATPLPALTTLLDDPLRVLRSVRFAARLRFTMDDSLREAAMTESVRKALAQKVARERVGSEVDLMLRSQDPVGAMRLIINLNLASTVFPVSSLKGSENSELFTSIFDDGLDLLTTTHDHLCDCKITRPVWCEKSRVSKSGTNGVNEIVLINDDESRRRLWYASLLKPLRDHFKNMGQAETVKAGARQGKKASRSVIMKIMVDELKRPLRDAEAVEKVMKAADDLTGLLNSGCAFSATACLLNSIRIVYNENDDEGNGFVTCFMDGREIDSDTETDPEWQQAMQYRLLLSKVLQRVGPLWRASMILSLSEQLSSPQREEFSYTIEGDVVSEFVVD